MPRRSRVGQPPVRAAILGTGSIARIHEAAIAECAGVELVAKAGRDGLAAVLADPAIDIVAVCTPSGVHAEHALLAIAAGKAVLVEKPLALEVADAARVVAEAGRRGLLLAVVAQRLLEPPVVRVQELVRQGVLGKPVLGELLVRWHRAPEYYRNSWRGTLAQDGGALMNQGIHGIGLLRAVFGPVAEVSGFGATLVHRIEAEDTSAAALRFESGALGVVAVTTAASAGLPAELNLSFERGTVSLHDQRVVRWDIPGEPPPAGGEDVGSGAAAATGISTAGHVRVWRDVVRAIRGAGRPAVTGEDGLADVAIVSAIRRSWQDGRSVLVSAGSQQAPRRS